MKVVEKKRKSRDGKKHDRPPNFNKKVQIQQKNLVRERTRRGGPVLACLNLYGKSSIELTLMISTAVKKMMMVLTTTFMNTKEEFLKRNPRRTVALIPLRITSISYLRILRMRMLIRMMMTMTSMVVQIR